MTMGMTVDQLANSDLCYAPPFSPAMDNIITAANIARNKIDGYLNCISPIEVHEMIVVEGMMEMREVEDLNIPANGQIRFEPGGKHLMLMGPKEHLTTGQKVDMTLVFKSGKKQTVSIQVAAK